MNAFNEAFPESLPNEAPCPDFEVQEQSWPPVPGDYFAFSDAQAGVIAVTTLASVDLAEALAKDRPQGLCIVGKTETENIGIDKVVKNVVTNRSIRFLIVAGNDPQGHLSGSTLLALWQNGVNDEMRVVGSEAKRPILKNVSRSEVEAFRSQIEMVDMVGCEDIEAITKKITELAESARISCNCQSHGDVAKAKQTASVPIIQAREPGEIELDKAGYFVVIPDRQKMVIVVEHYSYDNSLLGVVEGDQARSIYSTIIENGWVTQLSHAAYLGKELTKAELSMEAGFKYSQDGA